MKKSAKGVKKAAPIARSEFIKRELCMNVRAWAGCKDRSTALAIMPFARPVDSFEIALREEVRIIFRGQHPPGLETALTPLLAAYREHRVLFGWSPYRAAKGVLSWDTWDSFCMKWLGRTAALHRVGAYSLEALQHEVDKLVRQGAISLVEPHPWRPLAKADDEEPARRRSSRLRKNGKSRDDSIDDENDD